MVLLIKLLQVLFHHIPFNWSNGSVFEDLSSAAAGTYELVINDLNSCESVLTFDLTQPTPLITDIHH